MWFGVAKEQYVPYIYVYGQKDLFGFLRSAIIAFPSHKRTFIKWKRPFFF